MINVPLHGVFHGIPVRNRYDDLVENFLGHEYSYINVNFLECILGTKDISN